MVNKNRNLLNGLGASDRARTIRVTNEIEDIGKSRRKSHEKHEEKAAKYERKLRGEA